MRPYRADLKSLARQLRKHMTEAEQRIWQGLRGKAMGVPAYRQKPLLNYVVDFYLPAAQLIIELDGGQHYTPTTLKQDEARTQALENLGFIVLRFTNLQALQETDAVLTQIWNVVQTRLQNPP